MPIYEYRCQDCNQEFERIVFRREEEVACPDCGTHKVEKLLSTFAVGDADPMKTAAREPGPCGCGAPRRGMCGTG